MHSRFFSKPLVHLASKAWLRPYSWEAQTAKFLQLYPGSKPQDLVKWQSFIALLPAEIAKNPNNWAHPHPDTLDTKIALLKLITKPYHVITSADLQNTLENIDFSTKKTYFQHYVHNLLTNACKYADEVNQSLINIITRSEQAHTLEELIKVRDELQGLSLTHDLHAVPVLKTLLDFVLYGIYTRDTADAIQSVCINRLNTLSPKPSADLQEIIHSGQLSTPTF